MIIGKKNEQQIRVDVLRLIYNRSLQISQTILVNGHGQIGKSTLVCYACNRLEQIKRNIPLKRATWREWDWKSNTATDPRKFVELWDSNREGILVLEEAGETMPYLEWYGIMSKVFSSTTRVQGRMKNTCFLVTPRSKDITKYNRENVDAKMWVRKRDDIRKYTKVSPRYVKINYLKETYKLGWLRDWEIFYPARFLKEAKKFTLWLEEYKDVIAEKNKRIVGITPDIKLKFDQKTGAVSHIRPFKLG